MPLIVHSTLLFLDVSVDPKRNVRCIDTGFRLPSVIVLEDDCRLLLPFHGETNGATFQNDGIRSDEPGGPDWVSHIGTPSYSIAGKAIPGRGCKALLQESAIAACFLSQLRWLTSMPTKYSGEIVEPLSQLPARSHVEPPHPSHSNLRSYGMWHNQTLGNHSENGTNPPGRLYDLSVYDDIRSTITRFPDPIGSVPVCRGDSPSGIVSAAASLALLSVSPQTVSLRAELLMLTPQFSRTPQANPNSLHCRSG